MDREKLTAQLAKHEGYRQFPYRDTVGKLTIGFGRNLDDVGILREEAQAMLMNDIDAAERGLRERYDWFADLDPVRQAVLVNLAFNLGIVGLSGFRNTLAMVASGDYEGAATGMLHSKWAGQVGNRAKELATQMLTGRWA